MNILPFCDMISVAINQSTAENWSATICKPFPRSNNLIYSLIYHRDER